MPGTLVSIGLDLFLDGSDNFSRMKKLPDFVDILMKEIIVGQAIERRSLLL
jgi:hypothetical protein